jgi:hypothetical protein
MPARSFPPPWSVEEQAAYFVVRDHNGQQLVSKGALAEGLRHLFSMAFLVSNCSMYLNDAIKRCCDRNESRP